VLHPDVKGVDREPDTPRTTFWRWDTALISASGWDRSSACFPKAVSMTFGQKLAEALQAAWGSLVLVPLPVELEGQSIEPVSRG
jgi:hypothetical protein